MKYFAVILTMLLLLTACAKQADTPKTAEPDTEMFTDSDVDTEYSDTVTIELDGDSAKASSDTVKIADGKLTITEEATYHISGSYNGMIIVNADDKAKPQLVFDSVAINSDTSAALYILEADKVVVTLEGDNTFTNGGSFEAIDDNNIDAAVFSKKDLTFNGTGTLEVDSPVGHGIVCKDDLVFTGGSYTVNSASHGIDANDSIRITDSTFTVDSGKDSLHAENTDDTSLGFIYIESGKFTLSAEGDGISAGAYMQIEDGEFDITSGGGSENASQQTSGSWGGFMGGYYGDTATEDSTSIKGIKAATELTINGGSFKINSADDAAHSNLAITVNGGSFEIKSGDDGFHADETLVINAGTIDITECYEGLEGFEVTVKDGDISIYASDDGINAAGGNDQSGFGGRDNGMFGGHGGMGMDNGGVITIEGGKLYLNASGDALDSNGELYIKGGDVIVSGPTVGDTAILDFATESIISGGTFVGTGGNMMNECFDSTSTQGVIMINAQGSADTAIILTDSDGNILIDHGTDQSFSCIILSCPEIVEGETYTLTVGTESVDITMTSMVYSQGGFGGPGGMPGGPGGGHGPGGGRPWW